MVAIACRDVVFHNIQAVVFDKDGTLANSEAFLMSLGQWRSRLIDAQVPGLQEPLLAAFGYKNQRLNPAGLLALGTRFENEIAAAGYVAAVQPDWLRALTLVRSAFEEADQQIPAKVDQTPLVAGGLNLIQRLTAVGVKLGLLSSDLTCNVEDFVQRYQLGSYIQVQMGADASHGRVKPHPDLLREVCDRLAVTPEVTLVIGDSQADIDLAHHAGAAGCIGVTWGWMMVPNLADAEVVISHVEQIQVID